MMDSVKQDIAFAVKQLRRHAGVGVVVVMTLAVGIGATTAIFSAVHGVLLRPLPYDASEGLVMITSSMGGSNETMYLSGPDMIELAEEVESVDQVMAFSEPTIGPLTEVDVPEHVLTAPVTWNLFHVLGVDAASGRTFVEADGTPLPQNTTVFPPVASVISHDFWERKFGSDPDVLGRTVGVWGSSSLIVGVLPEGFRALMPPELNIGANPDIYRVMRSDLRALSREGRWLRVVGRLAGGASLERAQGDVEAFATRLRARHPHHAQEETRLRVASLMAAVAQPVRGPLDVLMPAVSLVLLIACANVANLLLARGAARVGEMAVRSSLGAGGLRLVRQLLTESAVLAGLGGLAGIALAAFGVKALQAFRPNELHRFETVSLDAPVLLFTATVAVAATIIAGLLPALQSVRSGLRGNLDTRGSIGTSSRLRGALVVGEVALSVILLVGTGLLIRTFSELQRMPLGFEPEQVLTVTATQTGRPREERQAYETALIEAVERVPGVNAAGIVFPLPMNGVYERDAEYVLSGSESDPTAWRSAYFRTVSPTYFDAMGLRLQRGRQFNSADEIIEAPVVILDERLARQEFPDSDPLGQRIYVRGMEGDTINPEIVGVVAWAPQGDHRDARSTMYFPRVQYQSHEVSVVARVSGDPALRGQALMAAIRGVDPSFPADLLPMSAYVSERLAASRFIMVLMEAFAGVALLLAAVGLYGVLSYTVRQRSKELGLRLALGAVARSLTSGVVLSGLRLASVGLAVGLVGALVLSRSLESQLFRVSSSDPLAFGGTALLVLLVSVAASLVPAVRASRVDPMEVLRED